MIVIAFEKNDWRFFYITTRSGYFDKDWVCVPVFFYRRWIIRVLQFLFSPLKRSNGGVVYDTLRANMAATVVVLFLKALIGKEALPYDVLLAVVAVPWGACFLSLFFILLLIMLIILSLTTLTYFAGL